MTRKDFWEITAAGARVNIPEQRNDAITERLCAYDADDIIAFEIHLRQVLDELDHFQIVDIQRVLMGMVTDDSYLYFRCWIISEGESFAAAIMKDGDEIVDKLPHSDIPLFEDLLYVATLAYGKVTGKTEEDDTYPRAVAHKQGLDYDFADNVTKGKKLSKAQLPKKFPKLWNHCRISPPAGSAYEIMGKGGFYNGPAFS